MHVYSCFAELKVFVAVANVAKSLKQSTAEEWGRGRWLILCKRNLSYHFFALSWIETFFFLFLGFCNCWFMLQIVWLKRMKQRNEETRWRLIRQHKDKMVFSFLFKMFHKLLKNKTMYSNCNVLYLGVKTEIWRYFFYSSSSSSSSSDSRSFPPGRSRSPFSHFRMHFLQWRP